MDDSAWCLVVILTAFGHSVYLVARDLSHRKLLVFGASQKMELHTVQAIVFKTPMVRFESTCKLSLCMKFVYTLLHS